MKINLSTLQEYSNIIRRLSKRGRSAYNHYLIKPLTTWSPGDERDIQKYLAQIHIEKRKQNHIGLPLLYKQAISRAVAPDQFDLSLVGTLCIKFMKDMKEELSIFKSTEAQEFFEILENPFHEYGQIEFEKTSESFTSEMMTADANKMASMVKRGNKDAELLIQQSEKLINEIIDEFMEGGDKFETLCVQYLVKTASPAMPDLHNKLSQQLMAAGLDNEHIEGLINNTAIIIYHEIMKSIKSGNLKRAIELISKYTIIFRGNPETPYHHEVDVFEKNLFSVIERKDLWNLME